MSRVPCRRERRAALAAAAAALLLAACGGGGDSDDGTPLPFFTVARTQQSGVASHEEVVLRGSSELSALWSRVTVDGAPLPSIDFSRLEVAGVFLGSRPSTCFGVEIVRVLRSAERVTVRYRETTPAPGAACAPAVVTPAHLVAFERSDLPVAFVAE